jgi:hypothetical protein
MIVRKKMFNLIVLGDEGAGGIARSLIEDSCSQVIIEEEVAGSWLL